MPSSQSSWQLHPARKVGERRREACNCPGDALRREYKTLNEIGEVHNSILPSFGENRSKIVFCDFSICNKFIRQLRFSLPNMYLIMNCSLEDSFAEFAHVFEP